MTPEHAVHVDSMLAQFLLRLRETDTELSRAMFPQLGAPLAPRSTQATEQRSRSPRDDHRASVACAPITPEV